MNRFPPFRERPTRRGYSLIELLIVISMSAVATGGSLVCISTMLKGERLTAVAVHESLVVARLSQTWKDDVHLAQECNVGTPDQKNSAQCDLVLNDGRKVKYRSSIYGISRDAQTVGSPDEHDVFQFSEGTRFQFQRVEKPQIVRLQVIRPVIEHAAIAGASSESLPKALGNVVLTFDAVPGRDVRLLEYLVAQPEAK